MARDWDSIGITWLAEKVHRADGNTKVEIRGTAQIPNLTNLEKFLKGVPEGQKLVTDSINGTSWRVTGQGANRRMLEKNPQIGIEELREFVWGSVVKAGGPRGVRVVEKKVHTLPGGGTYDGTDQVEYQQLYAAALIDRGTPNDVALDIASKMVL